MRKAVWLTYDLDTMDKISQAIPITYALISWEVIIGPLVPYKDNIWQKLFFFDPVSFNIPGFKMHKVFYVENQPIAVLYKVQRN